MFRNLVLDVEHVMPPKGLHSHKGVDFSRELREYLKNSKPEFITEIQEKKVMSPEAEAILKDAISEVVSTLVA